MQLVSFKISDDVAEKLRNIQGSEESISLVAKRLLLDFIEGAERKTPIEEKLDLIIEILQSQQGLPGQHTATHAIETKSSMSSEPSQPKRGGKLKHPKPICTECGSTGNHTNKGKRKDKMRWLCVDCHKTFTVDIGAA